LSDTIPPNRSPITHPDTRRELVAYLREAANPAFWRDETEVGFLIHFMFDDNDFRPAEQQIGRSLLNETEADAVTDFVARLDAAVCPRSKPLSKLKAADWTPVAVAAAAAQIALSEPWP